MSTEWVLIDGKPTETLREHLQPGLRAIFVGLNPSPVSVKAGHYYQGRLGRRFWSRLREYGIVPWERHGAEDDFAVQLGFGFADLVRRPTARGDGLSKFEKIKGVADLVERLLLLGDRPLIIFVFKEVFDLAAPELERVGFRTIRFSGPYEAIEMVANRMKTIIAALA